MQGQSLLSIFSVATLLLLNPSPLNAAPLPKLKPERISEIAKIATADPVFFTPWFSDRVFWDRVARERSGDRLIEEARKLAKEPIPELSQSLYEEKKRVGRRIGFDKNYSDRTVRLGAFLYAAGFSADNETWTPLITKEIEAILDEPAWSAPRIATEQKTWEDARQIVDLGSVSRAWNLALCDYLLGDYLGSELREKIRQNVRSRTFDPYLNRVRAADDEDKNFRWMASDNNWNAICNGGVLGAALLLTKDVNERAEILAAYEAYTPSYIAGFADDGYCREGSGYWLYGFNHYAMGTELIRLATGGKLDLLKDDKVRRIALFGQRWPIVNNLVPAFGDQTLSEKSDVGPDAPSTLMDFITLRLDAPGQLRRVARGPSIIHRHPLGAQLYSTAFGLGLRRPEPGSPEAQAIAQRPKTSGGLRDNFPDGGALIVRRSDPGQGLAAAFKGGHNAEPHNHNDLGSFVIVRDGRTVLTDLGRDEYMNDTFGPRRYESQVMNSFGHPVPMVAGQLQKPGETATAKIVSTEFTDARDMWTIDITSAYDVPDLLSLTRTFIFDRAGDGRVEIIDRVRFKTPQLFGTALVMTPGQKFSTESNGDRRFAATNGDPVGVRVSFETADGEIKFSEAPIIGIIKDSGPRGTRLGVDFAKPVTEATLKIIVVPDGN